MLTRSELRFCFLYLNTFCTCLTHIQRILIARYSTALSTFLYNIARFLSFAWLKRNNFIFVPLVLYYEEEGLVGVALLLLIRKYIKCSKLSMTMAGVLSAMQLAMQPAKQLANKIRPFKQRFLRITSNPPFLKVTTRSNIQAMLSN